MLFFQDWEHCVTAISILCHAILLWHLYRAGLTKYRYFKSLLAVEILQSSLSLLLPSNSTLYGYLYFCSSPVVWAMFFLVLNELVQFILEDFPGISSTVRKAFGWALIVAVAISAAFAIPGAHGPTRFWILKTFVLLQRSVILSLFLLLTLILGVLFYFRVPLSPNRKRYAMGYALYFAIGVAANVLVSDLDFTFVRALSLGLVAAASSILLAGVFLLRADGETAPAAAARNPRETQQRDELYRQLGELNRVLSKAARTS